MKSWAACSLKPQLGHNPRALSYLSNQPASPCPALGCKQVLTEQLDSLFSQTAAGHIEEVWVCVFSAPAKDYAVRVVDERNYSNVHLIVSDYNFKFYGRFQVRPVFAIIYVASVFDRCFSSFFFQRKKKGKNTPSAVRSSKQRQSSYL